MLQNKKLIFILWWFCTAIFVSGQGGTYRANNYIFGPQFGYGGSSGSRTDLKENTYLKLAGASVQFGMSAYKFTTPDQSFGGSLLFQQSKWSFLTKQTTAINEPYAKYAVNEKNILMPLEYNNYFTPYQIRGFFGLAVVPGFLLQKNLQRMKENAGDTTTAMIMPEIHDVSRFSMGFNAKIGLEGDMDYMNTGRIFLEFNSRFYNSKSGIKSQTFGVYLVVQYFFTN